MLNNSKTEELIAIEYGFYGTEFTLYSLDFIFDFGALAALKIVLCTEQRWTKLQ